VRLLAVLLGVALSLGASTARADGSDDDEDVRERLHFIQLRLKAEAPMARLWSWGWVSFNTVGVGYSAYRGATASNLADRTDQYVGVGKAAIGVLSGALHPLAATHGDAELRRLPESSTSERREKLATAERLLRRNAREVDQRYSLLAHALTLALNVAGAAIVWGVSKDAETAWLSAGIGVAFGELQIWTQPTRAKQDLRDYEDRFIGHYAREGSTRPSLSLVPMSPLSADSGIVSGAALQLRF
jgi:hypothetical protein